MKIKCVRDGMLVRQKDSPNSEAFKVGFVENREGIILVNGCYHPNRLSYVWNGAVPKVGDKVLVVRAGYPNPGYSNLRKQRSKMIGKVYTITKEQELLDQLVFWIGDEHTFAFHVRDLWIL